MPGRLLHPEYFDAPLDWGICNSLGEQLKSAPNTPFEDEGRGLYAPPEITVLIQSVHDHAAEIENLLLDVREDAWIYGVSRVKKLIVTAGIFDRNIDDCAKEYGAEVRHIAESKHLRSEVIRTGLEAAESDIVFTTVGHARLSNTHTLSAAANHAVQPNFGGAFGLPLRGAKTTPSEWAGARMLGLDLRVRQGLKRISPKISGLGGMGLMGADCSVLKPSVVKELGGFGESFGYGGADGYFGHLALKAGLTVMRDPLLSVHHTDGLKALQSLRLVHAWSKMGQDRPFVHEEWDWHPHLGL